MSVYIILLLQIMVAGGTHIIAKAVVADVDPLPLTFIRSLISSSGLMIILLARTRQWHIDRSDIRSLFLLGVLAIPLNQFLYLYGMKFSTAANGALLYATTPVFVLVLSRVVLKEIITKKKLVGVLLAFLGIVLVIFERGVDFSTDYTFGNIVLLVAVFSWAVFTILGKPMIHKYGALRTTTIMMVFGTIVFFPIGAPSAVTFAWSELHAFQWSGILYLGIGTSIIGYFLWYYALGKIEASKVAVFANGQPIVATILALLFLDYSLTGTFVIGGTIALFGVVLTQLG